MFEYAIALPVLLMLIFFAIAVSWYWWQQNIAAVALHEGTNLDAIHGNGAYGLPDSGAQRTKDILVASLGASASDFRYGYHIYPVTGARSVGGKVSLQGGWNLPLLGLFRYAIRAQSWQRDWQFYGGPPITGPKGEWE
jgi:hypothetical protein